MVDFKNYVPPGVYVEQEPQDFVTQGGFPAPVLTLIGSARGWQTYDQPVTMMNTPVALTKRGVLPDASPAINLTVEKRDGTVLVEKIGANVNPDYELVRGPLPGDYTTIQRVPASTKITEGEVVDVSYAYTEPEYYTPRIYTDYSSVEARYGPALVSTPPADPNTSHVLSPLSLAARVAFENGAGQVLCVPLESSEPDQVLRFDAAYKKIETLHQATLLVPIFDADGATAATYTTRVQTLITGAKTHCANATAEGYGRMAIVGVDAIYDDASTTFDEIANATNSSRVTLAYPYQMLFSNPVVGQVTTVGGPYLAAALGGILVKNEIRRGLTRQEVTSFAGIPEPVRQEMDTAFKNNLSAEGVTVVETGRNATLVVRHGRTTDTTDLLTSEISMIRTADALFQHVAAGMESAGLIGEPIGDDMTLVVKAEMTSLLETAVADNVILEWVELLVRQHVSDPTRIEVQFTYRPYIPLNYITVLFSIDLTTGQVDVDEAQIAA